jgi:dTDP-4-amino-4,6-dideoxygalactose transaminase
MINFNRPAFVGVEREFVLDALSSEHLSGDGKYGRKCQVWFEEYFGVDQALLTPSCTHALEMAAILLDLREGDEVIMPSFTFVSTANAFALRGARLVFVDVRPDTMNIDEDLIEQAITQKTKAIVVVHYAGVPCEMQKIMEVARRYGVKVIEDAAQAIDSLYHGKLAGTFGDMAAFSFHETKNITSGGEGGLLVINSEEYAERAEIIREKGTDRKKFFRGMVDKYSWVDIGSSYLPSELQAAYLWGQLQSFSKINEYRIRVWNRYAESLIGLQREIPAVFRDNFGHIKHNAHIFHLKCRDIADRSDFISFAKASGVQAVFHYVPLHSAPAGRVLGRFSGLDRYTTRESERLVRLPLWYGMRDEQVESVISLVKEFEKLYST